MKNRFGLILCLFFFSSITWAGGSLPQNSGNCLVQGQSDFTVYFDIYGWFNTQGIELKQPGSHPDFWALSTNPNRAAEMHDSALYNNWSTIRRYNAAISYQVSTGQLNYYRKPTSSSNWGAPLDTSTRVLHNGNIDVVEHLTFTANMRCTNSLPSFGKEYSDDPIYEFGVASCNGGSCDIEFNKNYSITPLVFVMPTVDATKADEDIPATLSVTSVTKSGASIVQEVPQRLSSTDTTPMTQVSYLVIEPGIADFNGHKVVADYADISSVSTDSSVSFTTINFTQVPGFSSFSSTPVVLGQVQSRNNADKWITTGIINAGRNSVQMSLDLSRSSDSNHNYQSEKVAFLASEPFQANLGVHKVEFNNTHNTPNTIASNSANPIQDGCESYATTSLSSITGVIANKQTRDGPDGGWLRRCSINNEKVGFALEEDVTGISRRHVPEQVGFFAFSTTTPSLGNLCPYFPQPAQSWKNDSKLELKSNKNGEYDYHIGGWSQEYIDRNISSGKLAIGFNEVVNPNKDNETCDVGTCKSGGEYSSTPTNVNPSFSSNKDLDLGNWNYASECPADNSNQYCNHEIVSGDVVITIKDHLKQLKVTGANKNKKMIVKFNSKSGNDGLKIEEYETNQHVISRFDNSGTYTFKKIKFNSSTDLHTGTGVVWRVQEEVIFSNKVNFYNTGITDDFIVFGPQAKVEFHSKIDNPYYGLILADTVLLKNEITLFGAVTANEFILDTSKATIVGESECFDPPSEQSYVIEVTEKQEFALLCENPKFNFTVKSEDTGQVAKEFNGNVLVSLPQGLEVDSVVTGAGSNGIYQPDEGILVLSLTSSNYGLYSIKGELETGETDTAVLYMAPYAFEVSSQPIYATAGRGADYSLRVKACKNNSSETVTSYSGDKVLNISNMSLSTPSLNEGAIEGDLFVNGSKVTSSTSANVTLNFSAGMSQGELNYDEAGKVGFLISDQSFDCPAGFDCEDEDGDIWQGLQGAANVNVRPWTFAICDPNGAALDGTSSSGSGYKAAGEAFSLRVKPIVYISGASPTAAEKCSAAVTKNFFNSKSQSATVYLRGELASPSSGAIGSGSSLIFKDNSGSIIGSGESLPNTTNSGTANDPWYEFTGMYWNEVGSLLLSSDIDDINVSGSDEYLGMVIDTGSREVGRFYPHHLTIVEQSTDVWDYASGHNGFAYMGQQIGHDFIIQAESSRTDSEDNAFITTNYGLFADSHISTIEYKVTVNIPDSDGNDSWSNVESSRVNPDELEWVPSDWGDRTGQIDVENTSFSFEKDGATLDGPFTGTNSNFGLVSDRFDNVDFQSLDFDAYLTGTVSGKRFSHQPVFRYGRMVLDDVGGNQGVNISIPLKTQYWDGSKFVINTDDSGSVVDSSKFCTKSIWSEIGSNNNVTLAGAATEPSVSDGVFSALFAQQTSVGREQVKVWLRQGLSKTSESNTTCSSGYVDQPWLQYFWNGADAVEEDPSAIVTFGIYRGNDRVIFRGENRFTGGNRFPEQ